MVDRCCGGLSGERLPARVLDDAAAAKFRVVREGRFFFHSGVGRDGTVSDLRRRYSSRISRKSIYQYVTDGFLNIGKDIVVATTAICWYVGIVVFNSDYAFTVTNVIIHGVPYFALIYVYARFRRETSGRIYQNAVA